MHSYVTLLPFPLHHTLSFLLFLSVCLSLDALGFCGSLTPPRKQDSVSRHPISQIHSYADQLKYNAQIKLDHYYRKLLIFRIYHLIMKMGKTNTAFNVGISHCRASSTLGSCSSFLFHLLLCLCKNCENKKKDTGRTFRQAINILSQFAFQCKNRSKSHLIYHKHFTLKICLRSVDLTHLRRYSVTKRSANLKSNA